MANYQSKTASGLHGLAEGLQEILKLKLGAGIQEKQRKDQQGSERLNQLLNDFDASAKTISSPENVQKVGPDVARTQYQNLRRRLAPILPKGAEGLLGAEPDFNSLDSSVSEREGGLIKDLSGATSADDPRLTPAGITRLAEGARVPTKVSFPMLGSSPSSDMSNPDPEFNTMLDLVKRQREGLLAKEPTEASTDVNTGVQRFTTARQRNAPGFTGTQTALTPEQETAKAGKTTAATAQATADVQNNPQNQAGAARGEGLKAGAAKRAELAAELDQMGITGQQQTGALQLADDFEKASGDYFKIRDAYKQVQGLSRLNTGQADTGMVFNYMKALDPNSSVREGEAATVVNAANIPTQIREAYNSAVNGTRLDPSVRTEIIGAVKTLYSSAAGDQADRVKAFTDRATKIRVPPSMVVREPSDPLQKDPNAPPSVLDQLRQRAGAP